MSFAGLIAILLISLSFLRHARIAMQRRGLQTALVERDATIGLLLGEFEEGADWPSGRSTRAKMLTGVTPNLARHFGRPAEALEEPAAAGTVGGRPLGGSGKMASALRDLAGKTAPAGKLRRPRAARADRRGDALVVALRRAAPRRGRGLSSAIRAAGLWTSRSSAAQPMKIDRMARFDSLTGLANRRQIMEALSEALVEAHREGIRASFLIASTSTASSRSTTRSAIRWATGCSSRCRSG